jgi:UDP-N-acetylmuramoyl-tripeptide--D-alanyl-D-alanine ligase
VFILIRKRNSFYFYSNTGYNVIMFKRLIQKKLESYVKKYFKKHPEVKLVVVAGSVGKTCTKIAVGTVLSEQFRVRLHEGNHNTQMSVPLAILGITYPESTRSFKQWLAVFEAARARIKQPTDVDVIVQELGADRTGEIAHFGTYLKPDIAVVTAVSPEHMEFFNTIETVAAEELMVVNYSKQGVINRDDIDGEYAKYITNANIDTYGTSTTAEYNFISNDYSIENGYNGIFNAPEWSEPVDAKIFTLGEHMLRSAVAAGAVGIKLGMDTGKIVSGLAKVRSIPGRMNVLRGVNETTIIDDSYNSSPLAAASSLRTLYQLSTPQKIAVLGDMNELGSVSDVEHEALGKMCDPSQLAWVVTVGSQAEKFIAPAAKMRGCQVKVCKNALEAGSFVHSVLEPHAVILFKGSQDRIYLEEAIKVILHSTDDQKFLVRQSSPWVEIKDNYFSKF